MCPVELAIMALQASTGEPYALAFMKACKSKNQALVMVSW